MKLFLASLTLLTILPTIALAAGDGPSNSLVLESSIPAYKVQNVTLPPILAEKCSKESFTQKELPINFDIDSTVATFNRDAFEKYLIVNKLIDADLEGIPRSVAIHKQKNILINNFLKSQDRTRNTITLFYGEVFNLPGGPFMIALDFDCTNKQFRYIATASFAKSSFEDQALYAGSSKLSIKTVTEKSLTTGENKDSLVIDLKGVPFVFSKKLLNMLDFTPKAIQEGWNNVTVTFKLSLENATNYDSSLVPVGTLIVKNEDSETLLDTSTKGYEFTELFNIGKADKETGRFQIGGDVTKLGNEFNQVKKEIKNEDSRLFKGSDFYALDFSESFDNPKLVKANEILSRKNK